MDRAPAHYSRAVCSFMNEQLDSEFTDQRTGGLGPVEWAIRSPDLTPCDFYSWGSIKSKVCATKARNPSTLEERSRNACDNVTPKILINVGQERMKRWLACFEKCGAYVKEYQ